MPETRLVLIVVLASIWAVAPHHSLAQLPNAMIGQSLPRDVREMYDRGLAYLAKTQSPDGDWPEGQAGPGVTGLCMMSFLATGEDPNFGLHSNIIRKAIRNIIRQQDATTGYYPSSMYHHGFAMLAMAEAYGTVDERKLWGNESGPRSIGSSLELAVRCAATSQEKNSAGGWRYSPDDNSADTSVSGSVLVGLLAARNAGIAVPDKVVDKAIKYYVSMTSDRGQVAYTGGLGGFDESMARISIGSLVYSLAKQKELPQYKATLEYLTENLNGSGGGMSEHYLEYTRYYQAQALFQGDIDAWTKWNSQLIQQLKATQQPDGSFPSGFGQQIGTSMSLLSLALNYRLLPIYER